jgi:hypothetical protein
MVTTLTPPGGLRQRICGDSIARGGERTCYRADHSCEKGHTATGATLFIVD